MIGIESHFRDIRVFSRLYEKLLFLKKKKSITSSTRMMRGDKQVVCNQYKQNKTYSTGQR